MSLNRPHIVRRRPRTIVATVAGALIVAVVAGCSWTPRGDRSQGVDDDQSLDPYARQRLDPQAAADVCLTAARQLETSGRDAAAIEQYERARSFQPRAKGIARRLAVLYERVDDRERAKVEYAAAVKDEPNVADLWSDYAAFQMDDGRLDEAEAAARRALALDAGHTRARVHLGRILAAGGRDEEAQAAFAQVVGEEAARKNLEIVIARRDAPSAAKPHDDRRVEPSPGARSTK